MARLEDRVSRLAEVPLAKREALARRRIFFGHQSVGGNIVDGMAAVLKARPLVALSFKKTERPEDFGTPVFAHAMVGRNRDPYSKIKAFREILEGGVGQAADIAFLKLCFIDIDRKTDLEALFRAYEEMVAGLKARFPDLKIVTLTVPLMSRPMGIRARLSALLGRAGWYREDNIQRNRYNEMLRAKFGDSLYDLARTESTFLDGRRALFSKDGKDYEWLAAPYTDDGGHLNALGSRVVAVDLLGYLLSLEAD